MGRITYRKSITVKRILKIIIEYILYRKCYYSGVMVAFRDIYLLIELWYRIILSLLLCL